MYAPAYISMNAEPHRSYACVILTTIRENKITERSELTGCWIQGA